MRNIAILMAAFVLGLSMALAMNPVADQHLVASVFAACTAWTSNIRLEPNVTLYNEQETQDLKGIYRRNERAVTYDGKASDDSWHCVIHCEQQGFKGHNPTSGMFDIEQLQCEGRSETLRSLYQSRRWAPVVFKM
ncbi:hypothetical protein DOTSEDRAFT_77977 [Dothistroma septosporum NZE10]|uniref:Uncharacterized protein n=1 Tax=Dothistroma septosporum (strain NZE10 / CBS 128990) TaxID=675120 RepID=N1PWI0_DOTSN|nr:hypothetical protein DOTSEDRAFT_77977 [Dothistroma septosporum NZE10]